jgi:hypothetical protein
MIVDMCEKFLGNNYGPHEQFLKKKNKNGKGSSSADQT